MIPGTAYLTAAVSEIPVSAVVYNNSIGDDGK